MILGTGERDRCRRGLVSCSFDWKQSVMSADEPRALSVYTAPVLLSWGVCPWIPPRTSSSPEPPVTLGSPLPFTAPSGVLSHPHCGPPAGPRTSFSIRLFLEVSPYTPGVWHTARSDLSFFLQRLNRLRRLYLHFVDPHSLGRRSSCSRVD